MGLEAGTYIDSLNAAWPIGATDKKQEGDDHFRLIKSTIQNTFPNLTGAMTATQVELNILDGATLTTAELNLLAGATLSTVELNYVTSVTSSIQTQLNARQPLDADLTAIAALLNTDSNFIVGNGSAWVAESGATARTSMGVDPAGTDNSTDVTLDGVPNYISLSGQNISRGLVDLISHTTATLPITRGGTGGITAAAARSAGNLDVDQAGTDNSTDVTIAVGKDYISIAGQILTLGNVDLTTDVTGALPYANMSFSNNIVAGDIAPDAVGQSEIAASAVGQGELKTATQTTTVVNAFNYLVMTGGLYTLWEQAKKDSGIANAVTGYSDGTSIYGDINTSSTTFVSTRLYVCQGTSNTSSFEVEYITASKPYDLGDGEIPLFVFLDIDNTTKEVRGVFIAEDPPWAYNGKTNTRPDKYKLRNGILIPYQLKPDIDICLDDCIKDPENMERYCDFMASPKYKEIEVTQEIKNKDMADVSHPLIVNTSEQMKGRSVVMIDPVSKITETLLNLHKNKENIGSLFLNGLITFGNDKLNRCGSECNHIVSVNWKHTK